MSIQELTVPQPNAFKAERREAQESTFGPNPEG